MGSNPRLFLAALAAGIALALSFPGTGFFFLAWVALVPYLAALLKRPSWRSTLLAHFLFSTAYFGGVLYWIPRVLTVYGHFNWALAAAVFLLMLGTLGLFLLPFSLLIRRAAARSEWMALASAPGLWVLTEVLRHHFAVGGFPWGALGYAQRPFLYLTQIADVGGVYWISFLVVLGNSALACLWRKKKFLNIPLAFAGLFIVFIAYGAYRVHFWQPPAGFSVTAALVQPAIELSKDREYYAKTYFETLPAAYRKAVEDGADWVIFPEAPNPFVFEWDFYFRTFWQRLVSDYQAPLLFNGIGLESESSRRYNSAFLLPANGQPIYRYDKIHLVPFGEYVPFGRVLGFARPLVQEVGGFSPGNPAQRIGEVGGVRFSTLICYEAIFPELSRSTDAQGATILVNLTNDLWFGDTSAPRQHLDKASFRAIELRKPLLRAANSGISALVDPWGRVQHQLDLHEKGALVVETFPNDHRSIYSRAGDWPILAAAVVSGLLALVGPRRRRASKKRRKS